jgi:hypothetical protein
MINKILTIRDELTGSSSHLYLAPKTDEFIRALKNEVAGLLLSGRESTLIRNRNDLNIYQIGEFDTNTDEIKPTQRKLVISLKEIFAHAENEVNNSGARPNAANTESTQGENV